MGTCDKGCQPDWHRDDCAIYDDDPTQPAPSDLAAILAEHWYVNGQQVGRICRCGWFSLTVRNASEAHRAHVAQVIADTYLPAVVREAEQRGREDNADHGMCYVHGSEALAAVVREAEARGGARALREAAADALASASTRLGDRHPGEVWAAWLNGRADRIKEARDA